MIGSRLAQDEIVDAPPEHREERKRNQDQQDLLLKWTRFVFDAGGVGFAKRLARNNLGVSGILNAFELLVSLLGEAR